MALSLLPLAMHGKAWTPETLPMVHLEDARKYVCNPDGVLSPAVADSIDAILFALERDKGIETVVVAVKRIEGGDPYTFAMDLGRRYGIGSKKQSTGLIVLLSTDDRCYQILTGNGLEGTLPDALCRRVENRIMIPYLKKRDWNNAMLRSMQSINSIIRQDSTLAPDNDKMEDNSAWVALLAIPIFLILLLLFCQKNKSGKRHCPICRRQTMEKRQTQSFIDKRGVMRTKTVWVCSHCGHIEIVDDENDNNQSGIGNGCLLFPLVFLGGGRGGFGGGFGRGGFGGGGGFTGGGSFSGGSFGGGGSGGRF